MDEKYKLTLELLELLEDMTLEQIAEFRNKLMKECIQKEPEQWERVKEYVDTVCDIAIKRLLKKTA